MKNGISNIELTKWLDKISKFVIRINNLFYNPKRQKKEPVFKYDVVLILDDEWKNHSPQGFRLNDKSEKIFNNWKDVFTGVLRELFRRNCNLFEQMVSEEVIKGRKGSD